jgi:hypothetical protein
MPADMLQEGRCPCICSADDRARAVESSLREIPTSRRNEKKKITQALADGRGAPAATVRRGIGMSSSSNMLFTVSKEKIRKEF